VANLPYYITSPVLRFFLEAAVKPQTMVVMVQKEVARQIAAKPGDMSLLSVAIQLYGEPRIVKYVPARSFYPAPAVDSAILKIVVFPRPRVEVETDSFFTLARAGFSAARKQIANSLAHALGRSKDDVLALLTRAGIDPSRRAETLSIEEWGRLWHEYSVAGIGR
jgi:16S rRNA (adenine1518-N6/adenine1519-N6)-dimethyltransferase